MGDYFLDRQYISIDMTVDLATQITILLGKYFKEMEAREEPGCSYPFSNVLSVPKFTANLYCIY